MTETSKLYLRPSSNAGYSEDIAIAAPAKPVNGAGPLQTAFTAELQQPLYSLRFDPGVVPGIYRLHAAEWRRFADGAVMLRLDAMQLRQRLLGVHGVLLPGADPIELWAVDDDPQFEIRWPAEIGGPAAIEVAVEWSCESIDPQQSSALMRRLLDSAAFSGVPAQASVSKDLTDPVVERSQTALELARLVAERGENQIDMLRQLLRQQDVALRETFEASFERHARSIVELREMLLREIGTRRALEVGIGLFAGKVDALRTSLEKRLDLVQTREAAPGLFASFTKWLVRLWSSRLDFFRRYRFTTDRADDLLETDGSWKVAGLDPRILLRRNSKAVPSAGWYAVDIALDCLPPDVLVDPTLYVDYGAGMCEEQKIPLSLGDGANHRIYLKFAGDVRMLRIDPTNAPGHFAFHGLSLRKMTRAEAALRLASPLLRRLKSPPEMLKAAGQLFELLRHEGVAGVERRLKELRRTSEQAYDYQAWIRRFDTLDDPDRATIREAIDALPRRPLFSILLPTYNTPERWLRRCLDCVLAQLYPEWELCIADDASKEPHVATVLSEYSERDSRVRVMFREHNGHIVAASNSALDLARGDYVVLLDHDDELPEHALYMVAERLARDPGLQMIYTDEDKIDDTGRRYDPYFKSEWNADLFRGQNMVSHLGVYATDLVREVGGFREGYEGSQDYDLALRCIERIAPAQIGHIPHVLYHWRALPGSTALATEEKDYAKSAAARALQAHFDRIGVAANVTGTIGGYHRVHYPLESAAAPLVSLIVPTRDRVDLLRICVDSILERTRYPNFEIVIVDNQSREAQTLAYFDEIVRDSRVRIIACDSPFNFSVINNFAVAQARGSVIGLINNDIEAIHPEWLEEMVSHVLRPEVGAVGAMLYYPDDRIQHAGVIVGYQGVAGHAYQGKPRNTPGQLGRARLTQELSCVTAACLLIRAEVYTAVGGLDENLQIAFNDVDFCLRIRRQGYRIVWTPFAELYHHESASRGYEDSPEKLARFHREVAFMQERWGESLLHDPAYNPNLALDGELFTLAWPPRAIYPFRTVQGT